MTLSNPIYPVIWYEDRVLLVDQTQLPEEYVLVEVSRSEDMMRAIETAIVQGTPAIGVAAAYGMYLGARELETNEREAFLKSLENVAELLRQTRPTAANLTWAISRTLKTAYESLGSVAQIKATLLETAQEIQKEDLQICQTIGNNGLSALPAEPAKLNILTYGNTGALATAGYGTALGVIRSAWYAQRLMRVHISETRPRFQGAKLTAWECVQDGIPATIITDNMVAHCLKPGKIDAVIVGADRIAANGDTVNKIGTYTLAVVARSHNVPFFVAAPLSTVDFNLPNGDQIPLEERHPSEIYQIGETIICPTGVDFYNPAFDVTPAEFISAIITERGTLEPNQLLNVQ